MRYLRFTAAAVMLISALVFASMLWATDNDPAPTDQQKAARAACQRVFDKKLDECMRETAKDPNPVEANFCIDIASQHWKLCLQNHGIDARQQRPPRVTHGPLGPRPGIAPLTPTPSKRPQIDAGSVTTTDPRRTTTTTPSKRKVIDSGAVGSVGAAKTPTPTPFGTPKPVPKKISSPTPRPQSNN